VILSETALQFGLSLVAVALVSWPILHDWRAIAILLICVVYVDLDLLMTIWLAGYSINMITMVGFVMAVGLVVDYLAHISHYFMINGSSDGSPIDSKTRMIKAMNQVGVAVFLGAMTTLLGVMPLSLASSFIYRQFFILMVQIILLGVLHGFVLVPVLLMLFF